MSSSLMAHIVWECGFCGKERLQAHAVPLRFSGGIDFLFKAGLSSPPSRAPSLTTCAASPCEDDAENWKPPSSLPHIVKSWDHKRREKMIFLMDVCVWGDITTPLNSRFREDVQRWLIRVVSDVFTSVTEVWPKSLISPGKHKVWLSLSKSFHPLEPLRQAKIQIKQNLVRPFWILLPLPRMFFRNAFSYCQSRVW